MKVKATVTDFRDVEITVSEAFKALRDEVLASVGLNRDHYINEKGQLVEDHEYWTSHSWTETRVVEKNPDPEKVALIQAFKTIGKQVDVIYRGNGKK